MKFLIADDSEGKTLMLKLLVEKSGIDAEIITATTTNEAKSLIDTNEIKAAFVDYEMPQENGPAVIAYLHKKQPSARIALASSLDSPHRQQEALDAGAEKAICTSYPEDLVRENVLNLLEEWK